MTRRSFAVLSAIVAAALLQVSSALAISQRGHVFSFHFGGASQTPVGVAVESATGDVYISRKKDVEQYQPVLEGGRLVGEEKAGEFKVSSAEGIAIDNSTESSDPSSGDVYVVSGGHAIYKFSREGAEIGKIKGVKLGEAKERKFSEILGIAVDPGGDLFVYEAGHEIIELNDAEHNVGLSQIAAHLGFSETGFAVNAEDDLYAGAREDGGVAQGELLSEAEKVFTGEVLAAGQQGRAFDVIARLQGSTGALLEPALDYEDSRAVAVNPSDEPANDVAERNDVYVVNTSGAAQEEASTVAEFASEEGETGTLIQRFSAPGLRDGDGLAVDQKTGTVYVADAAADSDNIDVFELESSGAPTVEGLASESPAAGGQGAKTLNAQVDPVGLSTTYYFEYGASRCAASSCTRSAPVEVASGFGNRAASLSLSGLQPGTYYYRVSATNADGSVSSGEATFAVLAPTAGLPDGRGWELVSPPDKDGAEPEPLTREGGLIEASEDGNAITYVADGPMPAGVGAPTLEGNRDPEYPQILSTRSSSGWSSQDLATPNATGSGVEVGLPPEYQFFSPNLAVALVQPAPGGTGSGPLATPPLSPTETQQKTIYLRDDEPLQPGGAEEADYAAAKANAPTAGAPGYVALVTPVNAPGDANAEFGGGIQEGLEFIDATPSLDQVIFKSWKDAPGYYEWVGPKQPLEPVNILPGSTGITTETSFIGGLGGADVRHAISSDGKLVFWTISSGTEVHLYARDTQTNETLQLDVGDSQHGEEQDEALFQTASANGSKVFFTDTQRLTPEARAVAGAPDLYVAELSGGSGPDSPLTDTVHDLTPQSGAQVLAGKNEGGGVLSASEEETEAGFNVYFAANGALASGAQPGHCPLVKAAPLQTPTTCNVYVSHYTGSEWEPPQFIAQLSSQDMPDWKSPEGHDNPTGLTSQASPNGEYLVFMSDRSLTGYDNEDAGSQKLRAEDRGYVARIVQETKEEREQQTATELEAKEAGEKGETARQNKLSYEAESDREKAGLHEEEGVEFEKPQFDEEVYLYEAGPGQVVCLSCDPSGAPPIGVRAQQDAGEGLRLQVDRPATWEEKGLDRWLAGTVPGFTAQSVDHALYQSRYVSNSGRVFFDSADPLVPLAVPTRPETVAGTTRQVGVENVYEYEPEQVGACASQGGCIGLISSGSSEHESSFLDASANGNDVFFLTAAALVPQDVDTNFDVYDAHVCEAASPCVSVAPKTPTACEQEGGEACQAYTPPPAFASPGSATITGSTNLLQQIHVLGEKVVVKPKPLTRGQKLAKALKACRKDTKRTRRVACEKLARKRFGPAKAKPKSKAKNSGKVGK